MSQTPTVYFIDDSATMREVIKIAFRRENINVVACHNAMTALSQMEQVAPDVVISDLIMPEKDGYEVCQFIKQHPRLNRTPVVLMSGVVNRAVAEKAFAVKADELIRKPFQPQDLIGRVRRLLNPRAAAKQAPPVAATAASAALSSIFAAPATGMPFQARTAGRSAGPLGATPPITNPIPPLPASTPGLRTGAGVNDTNARTSSSIGVPDPSVQAPPPGARQLMPVRTVAPTSTPSTLDVQKWKIEIMRLEGLVKKLQSELQAEREYSRALEEHVKTLREAE
ncbi:MAG TPA: response regulator [Terriglobales bacterium]|nr:response regulator [Terriglobales bacterium]